MKKLMGTNVFIGERDLKDNGSVMQVKPNRWVPMRPIGYIGIAYRIRCAWRVLRGQADIVQWKFQ